jgi:hypothetical protein
MGATGERKLRAARVLSNVSGLIRSAVGLGVHGGGEQRPEQADRKAGERTVQEEGHFGLQTRIEQRLLLKIDNRPKVA